MTPAIENMEASLGVLWELIYLAPGILWVYGISPELHLGEGKCDTLSPLEEGEKEAIVDHLFPKCL